MKSLLFLVLFGIAMSFPQASARRPPLIESEQSCQTGLITLRDQVPRHYEYFPAEPGKPTVVVTNGLVYDLENWDTSPAR